MSAIISGQASPHHSYLIVSLRHWKRKSVMPFAGSAIAQGAGKLSTFDKWRPGKEEPKWLLLGGATEPPKKVKISERRSKDVQGGSFLPGVTQDLGTMEASPVVKGERGESLYNTVRNYELEKDDAMKGIKKLFDVCKRDTRRPVIYYTGHGEVGTSYLYCGFSSN